VQAWVNGAVVGEMRANRERPDLAAAFPGLGTAHGYDLSFELPPGVHTLSIQAFPLDAPIDRFDVGTRVVGIGVPFGSLDVVGQVPGGIRVAGWIIDPDSDIAPPVHIYVDDQFAVSAVADRPRADVAAAFPFTGASHGFDVVVPAPPGEHRICAYAIDTTDSGAGNPSLNRLIGCRTAAVNTRAIGALDVVENAPGGIRVAGWALDPETAESLEIHVYVDRALAGVTTADRARPDIGALLPAWGNAHGFDVVVPAIPGQRDVCAYAIDAGSGGAGNPTLGCRNVGVRAAPFGRLEVVQRDGDLARLRGWAIDPATADPIDVHVQVGGGIVGVTRADLDRPDVGAVHAPYGSAHGFEIAVPVGPGRTQVCVHAIGVTPGNNTTFGCDFA
jgi:hypothetical protein